MNRVPTTDSKFDNTVMVRSMRLSIRFRAILLDEKLYGSDTEAFKPERFLLANGTLNAGIPHPETIVFGFGRRICPGRRIAMSAIWIAVVSMLATFDISRCMDPKDKGEEPDETAFGGGLQFTPLPFKCSIVPRSTEALDLVQAIPAM
ncbi:cytochrome P450 [Favolaschia claudopus]|uniref:Cytochrome P450 n=1 Tax=Favolaschia claudopus TaxID=2862362 RepID=A0AAV9Z8Y5_9AGAR